MEYKNTSELNQITEPKLILKSIDESRSRRNGRGKRVAIVYLTDPMRPGPFGNKEGDLMDEFIWRRNNSAPAPTKVVAEFLKPILKEKGIDAPFTVRWNRHAGCSMCPCSPGYTVTVNNGYHLWPYTIFLDWTN